MSRAIVFFVPTILVVPIVTILSTAQTSLAEPAADECKTEPGSFAPAGSHWYYRINRVDQRRCWFLGPEGMKARLQAREVSSPIRTPRRENAVETAREKPVPEKPVPMESAQKTSLEVASAESNRAAADFAAPLVGLPKTPDLDAREPTTTNDYYAEVRELPDAQKEMPLLSPLPTEAAARAGLGDSARESGPGALFLVGALAMLLCAGVIFKLARRHTQAVCRDRRMGPRRPSGLHPGQAVRANMNETAVRSKEFARRLPTATRQRPSSIDSAHDIKASLRKIMDDLERVSVSPPLRGAATRRATRRHVAC
jgi:hypothetical protein